MNDIIFEVLKLAVMVIALLVAKHFIPWVKTKIGAEELNTAKEWAKSAVLMAQQVLWQDTGENKKAFVTEFLEKILAEKGIEITDEQLNVLIEAAVKQMKNEESKGA